MHASSTHGHYQSHNKCGSHSIQSAIAAEGSGIMADQSCTLQEYAVFILFAPVTLTLTRWPSYTNLTCTPWRYTGCVKMNILRQVFRKLSYYSLWMHAFSDAWSLLDKWQWWWLVISFPGSRNSQTFNSQIPGNENVVILGGLQLMDGLSAGRSPAWKKR